MEVNVKKISFLLFLACFVTLLSAQEPLPEDLEMRQLPVAPMVELPANYDELIKNSKGNSMEKKIDEIIGKALKSSHVVIETLNDFMFLQVVPNFAYADEKGEERLGEDLMEILHSGKISASANSQFMSLDYTEMRMMGLPFKRKVVDNLVLGADKFDLSISLTFFINMNKLTNMVLGSLENIKDFKPVPDRQLPLPRAYWRRQDAPREDARRPRVRRREGAHHARHVGVPGAVFLLSARRLAARVRRVRRGRAAYREGAEEAVFRRSLRRVREGERRRLQHAAADSRRRPPY